MSDLENEAKPALAPLIQGIPRSLPTADQAALAAWGTKVMLLAPFLSKKDSPAPRAQYEAFHRRHLPPPVTALWIAAYGVGNEAATFRAFPLTVGVTDQPSPLIPRSVERDPRPGPSNGYTATLSIGQLAFHALSFVPDASAPVRIDDVVAAVPQGSYLAPLWPLSGKAITWPPGPAFDAVGLLSLASAWR